MFQSSQQPKIDININIEREFTNILKTPNVRIYIEYEFHKIYRIRADP